MRRLYKTKYRSVRPEYFFLSHFNRKRVSNHIWSKTKQTFAYHWQFRTDMKKNPTVICNFL